MVNPGGTPEPTGDPELGSGGLSELRDAFHSEDLRHRLSFPWYYTFCSKHRRTFMAHRNFANLLSTNQFISVDAS